MSEQDILIIDADGEIEKIIQRLDKIKDRLGAPDILQKAVKSTAQKVRRQIVKDAKGHYALTDESGLKNRSKGAPRVSSSKGAEISSTIISKGPMQDIMAFLTQPNTKTGAAAAQVLNDSAPKKLEKGDLKAFVTRFANGHVAIVQRKGPERLPVKKLLSPAVPHMLGNDVVRAKATAMAYDLLQAEIEKHIAKVLGNAA